MSWFVLTFNLIDKKMLHGIVPEHGAAHGDQNPGNQVDLFRAMGNQTEEGRSAPKLCQQAGTAGVQEQAGRPDQKIPHTYFCLGAMVYLENPFVVDRTVAYPTGKAAQKGGAGIGQQGESQ